MKCLILFRAREVVTKFSQSRLGLWPGRREDFDDVAVAQPRAERHHLAVDPCADALVADVGVNRVGEIDRRRIARKRLDLSPRREDVDLFRIELDLQVLQELLRVAHLLLPFEQLAQPDEVLLVAASADTSFLVFPVRRDPLFARSGACPPCGSAPRTASPRSLMTEVCSDWYPFGRGMAMKSLIRPGTGDHV